MLQKERDKAQEYLDIAAVMLVAVDVEERVGLINKKGCEILGYKEEEVIGKKWFDNFLPPRIKHQVRGVFEKLIRRAANPPEYYENLILTKDGDERLIAWHNTVLRNDEGQVVAILSSGEDITERKRAEEVLQKSEEQFRISVGTLLDGFSIFSAIRDNAGQIVDFRYEYINESGCQLNRRTYEEQVGHTLLELLPAHKDTGLLDEFAAVVETGRPLVRESLVYEDIFGGGQRLARAFDFRAVKLGDGFAVAWRDVTEHKIAEQRLLEDQAKLKSLASELTLAEERERRRIATELHDRIGQSLVISKMNLDELRQSVPDEKLSAVLDEVCNSLGQTIDDTRTLTFDLSSPILYELGFEAAVAEWLTEQIQEKHGIATQFEDDGQPKPLDDDIRVLLFRDVRELLINVVKHARAKNIKVSIHKVGSRICVGVQDDGVGFDPAEAASTAAKRAEFGLFSIRQRLEELGGHLEIKSEPGRGCKATMTALLKQE